MQEIIQAFFKERSLVNHQLASYNDCIPASESAISRMERIIRNIRVGTDEDFNDDEGGYIKLDVHDQDIVIRLKNVKLGQPTVKEANGALNPSTPMECRLRKLTYMSPVTIDFTIKRNGVPSPTETGVSVGNMPIMIRSERCNLHPKHIAGDRVLTPTVSDEDKTTWHEMLQKKGEDPLDPGGYFIINGTERVYLDHAASTPMRDVAFEAYKKTESEAFANSAGGHALSRKAKNILEESRDSIASHFGAAPKEITFTSGGTEADNWIIKMPFINNKNKNAELVTSAIEHEAVLGSAEWVESLGYKVNLVQCDSNSLIKADDVLEQVNPNTKIVSIMLANNETGVVQPIREISQGLKSLESGLIFHSDVVQAVATTKIDFHSLGVQSAAISGHKIGGPKGIGVMFLSSEVKLPSFFHGGKQELERRAGTVNVSGVASLSAALDEQQRNITNQNQNILKERMEFEEMIKHSLDVMVVGDSVKRLEHISNIQFNNINSETLMVALDLQGLGVSRGSACASGAQRPSHVLQAMKVSNDKINSHLRFSFGWNTQIGDGIKAAKIVLSSVEGMK